MAAFGEQYKNDLLDALLSFAGFMIVVFEVLSWFASYYDDEA